MPEMILPPFHATTVKRHQLEFPFALQQELEAYKKFYRHTYGAEVSEADLIREICRFFLATDEGFRQFKLGRSPRPRARSHANPAESSAPAIQGSQTANDRSGSSRTAL